MTQDLTITNQENEIQAKIDADCIALLNRNLLFGIPANTLCALVVFIGLSPLIHLPLLNIWFSLFLIISILRYLFIYVGKHFCSSYKLNLNLLILGTTLTAALWGFAGFFLMPPDNLLYQMFIILVLVGVTSAGLNGLQASALASFLFFVCTLTPLNLWLFYQESEAYFLLGLAIIIYLCFMLLLSWQGYQLLTNKLKLHYVNLSLINQLYVTNKIMEESEARFRSAFNDAVIGMALVSMEGQWLKVNKAICRIVGYSEDELLQTTFQRITYSDDLEADLDYMSRLVLGEISTYQMEKRYVHKKGHLVWTLLSVSLLRDKNQKPLYFISQIQDINAQKEAEEELKYIAYHDVLTGVFNRKQLEISFGFALAYAKRHRTEIGLLFIDLDHFKEVNDSFGHDVGDLLLIEISTRLQSCLRATDVLARLGGDEFIIILTDFTKKDQVCDISMRLLRLIAQPMKIKKHRISITCSIGIGLYPTDGTDLSDLIKNADNALYSVKSGGRNNFKLYSSM